MAKMLSGLITAVFLLSNQAQAQFAVGAQIGVGAQLGAGYNPMYGSGAMMGANNFCPYDYGSAAGSVDDDDEVALKKKEAKKAKRDWEKAKKDLEASRTAMKRHDDALKKRLNGSTAALIKEHIEYGANVDQWTSGCDPTASANTPNGIAQQIKKSPQSYCTKDAAGKPLWILAEFARDGGDVDPGLCDQSHPQLVSKSSSTEDRVRCQTAITEYGPAYLKYKEAQTKVVRAEEDYIRLNSEYESTRQRVKDELADGDTEGDGSCPSGRCPRRRGPSTGQMIGGGILAALGGYLSYSAVKHTNRSNERIAEINMQGGWPSRTYQDPYYAMSAGYPMMQAGLYGALGGGAGAGGFGCGGTIGGAQNGAFGYPPYMIGGQPGGGMWMPGANNMLPYPGAGGAGWPYGNGALPYPYGGANGAGGIPGIPGVPVGLMNQGGYPYGGAGGYNPLAAQAQQAQLMAQDYAVRGQAISQLQGTMAAIDAQIRSISMGGSYAGAGAGVYGGLYGGAALGGSGVLPYPGGTSVLPYPYQGVLGGASTLGGTAGYSGPGTPVRTGVGTGALTPVYGR